MAFKEAVWKHNLKNKYILIPMLPSLFPTQPNYVIISLSIGTFILVSTPNAILNTSASSICYPSTFVSF